MDSEDTSGRVAVLRGAELVPLIAGSHDQVPQPWKGIVLERHLVQAGEIPEHEHPSLCLHLQLAGERDFEWWQDGKNAIEQTRPGSLIVIPPGTRDRLHWQGVSERLIVSIKDDALERVALQLDVQRPPEIRGAWSLFDPAMRLLLAEMGRETRESWPLGKLYADLLALGLQSNLLKNYSAGQIAWPALKGGLGLAKLKRAMEYMTANLADDIGLEEIAAELGMSASHFAHEFRGSTGATPYQYLLQQRLERAKRLLRKTRLPVQTVSAMVGFGYAANFVRTFRQRVGVSPEVWRKEQAR